MTDLSQDVEINQIEPKAIFGFDGKVEYGLQTHPDGKHIVFPIGSKIGIANHLHINKEEFLSGHTNTVSSLDISPSGKLFASGQINHMGFRAYVILWDWKTRTEISRHDLHKVRVQSVCFTAEDKYLVSIGGQDDGSIIVYDVENNTPICRSVAAKSTAGIPSLICRLHNINSVFIVAGDRHLRIWSIQRESKKLFVHDVSVGKYQRRYTGMRVDSKDEILYLGTMTGDIIQISLNCCHPENVTKQGENAVLLGSFGIHNPRKPKDKDCVRYINGVRDLYIISEKLLLIGAGDGSVELIEDRCVSFKGYKIPTWPRYKTCKKTKVNGAVTSLARFSDQMFFIATDNSEIYSLNICTFDLKLLKTCHKATVYDIVFPRNFSLVFATASHETIRIWSTKRMQELLRIIVYNFSCASIVFSYDGRSLISAWNDGVIRAFTPLTGKLIFAIPNAHNKGCTALTISANGKVLVSGGVEGQVRVWKIEPFRQSLIGVLKEHSAPIATVDFNKFFTEIVSASSDGCFIIWDIDRLKRKHVVYVNAEFMCARYYPTGVQILTAGSDRRISYWEVYDGSLVRELEGSSKASVNCVSMNSTGEYFVSCGNDQMVKLWDYQKGITLLCGNAHAAPVISCVYSPCGKFFVTGSADGAVIVWDIPEKFWPKNSGSNKEEPLGVISNAPFSATRKLCQSRNKAGGENISELETSRSKKGVLLTECPPVDPKAAHDINETCNYIPATTLK